MIAIRAAARTAVRPVQRISTPFIRQSCRSTTSSLLTSWRQPSLLRPIAAFSTSTVRSSSQVNKELSDKIESELKMEKGMRDPDTFPTHLKEFLEGSDFELLDTPGKEEVVMTRKFGDESIRIVFSIDDLNNTDEDPDAMSSDPALMDDMEDADMPADPRPDAGSKKNINQGPSGGRNFSVAPEDSIAPADREGLAAEEEDFDEDGLARPPSFTTHVFITIDRPSKGALQVEAMAQDGMIMIENVYYYNDGKLADPKSHDDEVSARDLYTGPPFGNLDEDLQILFEKYLDERGINSTLALFVPEYIDYKEQREYTNWLSGIKRFFD